MIANESNLSFQVAQSQQKFPYGKTIPQTDDDASLFDLDQKVLIDRRSPKFGLIEKKGKLKSCNSVKDNLGDQSGGQSLEAAQDLEKKRQQKLDSLKSNFNKDEKVVDYESETIELYTMISNEFDYDQIRLTSASFSIKQYKDSIYRGEIHSKTHKRHGRGVIVYDKGRIYEGSWSKDKRHGSGFELFANGNSYQGQYSVGKPHGKGLYTWRNGEKYEGEFHQGMKEGHGLWKGTGGDSYLGKWKDNKAHGYGVHTWVAGDKYEGEWKQCLRDGQGTDFFANGDVYVGEYADGQPEGQGLYKWTNGDTYSGGFKRGVKHGQGRWKQPPGNPEEPYKFNQFEGTYVDDLKHGPGCFQWAMGNKYTGQYMNDEREGWGKMEWIDGSIYKGQWKNGIQQGIGLMIYSDKKRAGYFENNVFVEPLLKMPDNVEFVDDFKEYFKEREARVKALGEKAPEGAFDSEDEVVGQQFKAPIKKLSQKPVSEVSKEKSIEIVDLQEKSNASVKAQSKNILTQQSIEKQKDQSIERQKEFSKQHSIERSKHQSIQSIQKSKEYSNQQSIVQSKQELLEKTTERSKEFSIKQSLEKSKHQSIERSKEYSKVQSSKQQLKKISGEHPFEESKPVLPQLTSNISEKVLNELKDFPQFSNKSLQLNQPSEKSNSQKVLQITQSVQSLLPDDEQIYEIKENRMQKVEQPQIGKPSNEPYINHEGLKRVYVPKKKKELVTTSIQCELLKSQEKPIPDEVNKSIEMEFNGNNTQSAEEKQFITSVKGSKEQLGSVRGSKGNLFNIEQMTMNNQFNNTVYHTPSKSNVFIVSQKDLNEERLTKTARASKTGNNFADVVRGSQSFTQNHPSQMSNRSKFSIQDKKIMEDTQNSVRRFKESVISIKDKIRDDFTITEEFFNGNSKNMEVQTDIDMSALMDFAKSQRQNSQRNNTREKSQFSGARKITPLHKIESENSSLNDSFGDTKIQEFNKQLNYDKNENVSGFFDQAIQIGLFEKRDQVPERKIYTRAQQSIINARQMIRQEQKTANGPRFVGFSVPRERPIYNETTISFPRADAYSVYTKTSKKPPMPEKKTVVPQDYKPIKIEPIARQIKIRKFDAIHENTFRKNKSPLGAYLRRDNFSISPARDNSLKKPTIKQSSIYNPKLKTINNPLSIKNSDKKSGRNLSLPTSQDNYQVKQTVFKTNPTLNTQPINIAILPKIVQEQRKPIRNEISPSGGYTQNVSNGRIKLTPINQDRTRIRLTGIDMLKTAMNKQNQ